MPLRQTIGISLALLVISAGAIAKTPEKNTSSQHQAPGARHGIPEACAGGKSRTTAAKTAHHRSHSQSAHRRTSARHRHAAAAAGTRSAGSSWGPMHATGAREVGRAAWYGLVGGRTSNGEILDTVSATAAHRTLPLSSYARVTNLDSGRSVIVKINDRGPQSRQFVIDLSPRAADELEMRRAGVANVIVEPVVPIPVRAEAVALYSGSTVAQ